MRRYLQFLAIFVFGLAVGTYLHGSSQKSPAGLPDGIEPPESIAIAGPGESATVHHRVIMVSDNDTPRPQTQNLMLVVLWYPRDERTGRTPHTAIWCEAK